MGETGTSSQGKRGLIIAIDGPAGVGKSTVARLLALQLGYLYLDTGALYRAVAWKVRDAGLSPDEPSAIIALLPKTTLHMACGPEQSHVLLDGRDITGELRTPGVTALASMVSAIPAVREWLLPVQRQIGAEGCIVAEGRDIGTRVFPEADVKFFLEADAEVRATRRHRELVAAGHSVQFDQTKRDLTGRDDRDRSRTVAPLIPAPDAERIDTSSMPAEAVVEHMMAVITARL
ncbi:MAG: (d)CMP kinase [Nitrospira sp.]|nr:(d)CMP kinase [Nitrospira sp.]